MAPDPAAAREQRDEDFAARIEEAQSTMALMKEQGYAVRIARQARSAAKPASGGAYSVLIVEDEPALLFAMRKFLELEGFVPRVAANRDEAAAELRKPPLPDLILLDGMLSGASGFDILQRLRGHPALKQIPVIMVTAMSAREDVMRALAADANGYITKPFKQDVLMKSIKAVLGIG
jgi:CheY-like chemotaxis protein